MRFLILIIMVSLITGCASAPGVDKSFISGASGKTGIIIFSFTKTGRYGNIPTGKMRLNCDSDVEGEIADGKGFVRYIDGGSPDIPISANLNITKERPLGLVHILELPAGNCKLFSYSGLAYGMNSKTTANSLKPFSIKFEVKDGKTVYIGNFNTEWSQIAASYTFNDYFDRDIKAIQQQSPDLLGNNIEKQISTLVSR